MRETAFAFLVIVFALPVSAKELPPGTFDNQACVECHDKKTTELVSQWRASVHAAPAPVADCVSCHGERHDGAAARARQNDACTSCHGGLEGSVVRSYVTSKHGVIATIEGSRWDWSRRLTEANYRAPSCAYCHLYDAQHDVGVGITPWNPLRRGDAASIEKATDTVEDTCRDCHSSRYAGTLLAAGQRNMEIGRLKMREAQALLDSIAASPATAENETGDVKELRRRVETMRSQSGKGLRHGIVHYSPDYLWWYGQAALDGDLLRIKATVSRILRRQGLSGGNRRAR
ncbi:MAG TPA: multiheme c-type cytochrome [Rhodospirillales bacterium]|nr:multiheme c-type cytochrome [Rhodospirillales bacterium]